MSQLVHEVLVVVDRSSHGTDAVAADRSAGARQDMRGLLVEAVT